LQVYEVIYLQYFFKGGVILKIGKVEITKQDKLLFENPDYSKKDIAEYYSKIWKNMKLHMIGYPVTLQRFPNGIKEKGFYQKNASDYFPKWLDRVEIQGHGDTLTSYPLCNDVDSLVYLVNQGTITFHTWLSSTHDLEKPDKIIFDLDPPKDDLSMILEAAFDIKEELENLHLKPFVMTTGSTGLHIITPIKPEYNFEQIKEFAKKVAYHVTKNNEDKYTTEQRKDRRDGKIFIDILRNAKGQTGVCPYSLRPISGAPVATPLDWNELAKKDFDSQKYNIKNIFRRLGQIDDPWKDFKKSSVSIADGIKYLKNLS
jgi:bifunctional non-homologous end joining protein LigD